MHDGCAKEFYNSQSLKLHQNLHLARQISKLRQCHVEVTHQGKRHKCQECGKEFKHMKTLRTHVAAHAERGTVPKWQCHLCEKKLLHEPSLNAHREYLQMQKWHVGEGWNCDQCGATFAFKKSFLRHRQDHEEKEWLPCEICGAVLKNKDAFKRDLKANTDDRKWDCGKCGKKFRVKEHLTQHQRIHSGERPFACNECGKAFNQAGTLWHHRELVHRSFPAGSTKK